jgi:hypothetical protein
VVAVVAPYLRRLWWSETLSAAEVAELRNKLLALECVRQPQKLFLDLSILKTLVEQLNLLLPTLLEEEDKYLAARIHQACIEAAAQPASSSSSSSSNPRVVVAVVNLFRLPGIRAAFPTASSIRLDELESRPSIPLHQVIANRILPNSKPGEPWWLRPAVEVVGVVAGVYTAKYLARLLLPRWISEGFYPAISIATTGYFAQGACKTREYAETAWTQPVWPDPYGKLLITHESAAVSSSSSSTALVPSSSLPHGSTSKCIRLSKSAIDARVKARGRAVASALLGASV